MAREVAATLNNRAFVIATITGMFVAIAVGARNALEIYFGLYFWELSQSQLAGLVTVSVVGSAMGVVAAPQIAKRIGKKHGAILMFASALLVGVSPVVARLVGVMPDNGTGLLYGLLIVETVINTALAVLFASLVLTLLVRGQLFNPEFVAVFRAVSGVEQDTLRTLAVLLGFSVAGVSVWDIIDGWLKKRRDGR